MGTDGGEQNKFLRILVFLCQRLGCDGEGVSERVQVCLGLQNIVLKQRVSEKAQAVLGGKDNLCPESESRVEEVVPAGWWQRFSELEPGREGSWPWEAGSPRWSQALPTQPVSRSLDLIIWKRNKKSVM